MHNSCKTKRMLTERPILQRPVEHPHNKRHVRCTVLADADRFADCLHAGKRRVQIKGRRLCRGTSGPDMDSAVTRRYALVIDKTGQVHAMRRLRDGSFDVTTRKAHASAFAAYRPFFAHQLHQLRRTFAHSGARQPAGPTVWRDGHFLGKFRTSQISGVMI